MAVYKEREFAEFIKLLGEGQVGHWQEIAEAIGVEADTITRWKKTPEAIEARRKGIAHALAGMEKAGSKDWRMYEAKLKMLGINPAIKVDAKVTDTRRDILERYGLPYAGKAETVEGGPPQDTA